MADSKIDSVLDQLKAAREAVSGKIDTIDEENGVLNDEINKLEKKIKDLDKEKTGKQSKLEENKASREELVAALGGEPDGKPAKKKSKASDKKTEQPVETEEESTEDKQLEEESKAPEDDVEETEVTEKPKTRKKKVKVEDDSDKVDEESSSNDKADDPWDELNVEESDDSDSTKTDDVDVVNDDVFGEDDDEDFL